ncbi:MAG: diacylglycerol kinase [Rhodobacteraceae bacterium]|nr:diacylglycerol kinase [Paracoccaceae bacterium]
MRRFFLSFKYAWHGLREAWRSELNFRVELCLGMAAVVLALALGVSLTPVLLACGLVLSAELFNSAIEAVVDLASPEQHPLAKRAKDFGAAAVLIASITAGLMGLFHLGPPLWAMVFGG